jgi:uncharacterized delta-60 repeat protein
LARYNSNGTIDSTFGVNGKTIIDFGTVHDLAYGVALQSNGNVVIAGATNTTDGLSREIALARCNSSGFLDSAFGVNGKTTTSVGAISTGLALTIQADDKILVAGVSNSYNNSLEDFCLIRYKSNGSLDSTFNINGKALTDFGGHEAAAAVALQPDAKAVAAGYFYSEQLGGYDFAIARYKGDEPVTINIKKDVTTPEGNSGTTPVTFKIVLNETSSKRVIVNYTTVDGTAKAGTDYVATSGTLTFKPGVTKKRVTVNIIGDNVVEKNEKFSLQLSNPKNAILGTLSTATCTIKNDDPSFANNSLNEDNATIGSIKFYPNPAKDILRIEGLNKNANTIISVVDLNGKVVTKNTISNSACSLNVKQLLPGTYFVKIESEHKSTTLKFVKE